MFFFFWGGGRCLLSSFTLFRIKYVRYLKTFWCKFLMRVLMLDFEILSLVTFFYRVFVHGSSYSICNGYVGVYFPSLLCRVLINGSYSMCLCLTFGF